MFCARRSKLTLAMQLGFNCTAANSSRKSKGKRVDKNSAFFLGGRDFQHREEGFLRYVHLADALHAALALFLLFEEFTFARDVAAVALRENVLAHRGYGFARDDAATDRSLNGNFKHLARNQFAEAGDEFPAA